MLLISVTAGLVAATTLLGLVSSLWLLRHGPPRLLALRAFQRDVRSLYQRLPLILLNQLILIAGVAIAVLFSPHWFTLDAPPVHVLGFHLLLTLAANDVWFYWEHRLLHANRYLYRTIHSIHHRASAPLPIEYIYAHPLEWLVGSIGPGLVMAGIVVVTGRMSAWTMWGFLIIRHLHELVIHSGLHAVIGSKIPFWGTADQHDLHHARPSSGNYGSISLVWDKVFGTEARVAPRPPAIRGSPRP